MAFPYQPYQFPYQQNYYPVYQPQQTQVYAPPIPQNPAQTQAGIIWISGEREAQMYPVAPNNAVTLWSQTEPVVYLKQADATGKPTLKVYDLVERVQNPEQPEKADAHTDDYVRKADLAAVIGAVKGLDEVVGGIKTDIDSMRGDLYGIAGKKKSSARKQEADDDE